MSQRIPRHTGRLFGHHSAAALVTASGRVFVALRLAEEGDRRDLRWLVGELGEEGLRQTLIRYGGRQLSRRSLAFWRHVLDLPVTSPEEASPGAELWPR